MKKLLFFLASILIISIIAITTPSVTMPGNELIVSTDIKLNGSGSLPSYPDRCFYSAYSEKTLAGVQTAASLCPDTAMGTRIIPANFFTVGKTIRYRLNGYYTTDGASGNATVLIEIAGQAFKTTGSFALDNSVTNGFWQLDGAVTCFKTGATGYLQGRGNWVHSITSGGGTPLDAAVMTPATRVLFNTTSSGEFCIKWTATDAGTSITIGLMRLWEVY